MTQYNFVSMVPRTALKSSSISIWKQHPAPKQTNKKKTNPGYCLTTKEMQIKITMRHHLTGIRVATAKEAERASVEGMETSMEAPQTQKRNCCLTTPNSVDPRKGPTTYVEHCSLALSTMTLVQGYGSEDA